VGADVSQPLMPQPLMPPPLMQLTGGLIDLRVRDLTVTYDRHPAVHHVTGQFAPGSLTAIIGPNGAGKSTLLKALAGLMRPSHGDVIAPGLTQSQIGYLPQQAEINRRFPLSVLDLVTMGHWHQKGTFGAFTRADQDSARRALDSVGLAGFGGRALQSLSAGQFQRALFARLMLQDAQVILLDEPFNAVDAKTTADLINIIRRWHGEDRLVITVLHDMDMVRRHFDQTLLLARELVGWGPTAQVLTPENLLIARRMAEAWDDDAAICAQDGG